MTAYEIVNFLHDAGSTGVFEIECDKTTYYVAAKGAAIEAVSDQAVKLAGRIGYGVFSLHAGSVLLDSDQVSQIFHHVEACE